MLAVEPKPKLLAIEISEDLHKEIKEAADKEDRSMAALIRVAVREYLERRKVSANG